MTLSDAVIDVVLVSVSDPVDVVVSVDVKDAVVDVVLVSVSDAVDVVVAVEVK